MKIYTVQNAKILQQIEHDGYYRPNTMFTLDNILSYPIERVCYRWMIDMLYQHCGLPFNITQQEYDALKYRDDVLLQQGWDCVRCAQGFIYYIPRSDMPHPVWGLQKCAGQTTGKVNTKTWYTTDEEDAVLLSLDISPERLLFSDFSLWHVPLNGGFLPAARDNNEWEKQLDRFEQKCIAAGFQTPSELFCKGHYCRVNIKKDPLVCLLQQELINSWKNCLVDIKQLGSVDNPISFDGIEWIQRETQCVFWEIFKDDIKDIEFFTTRPASQIEEDD